MIIVIFGNNFELNAQRGNPNDEPISEQLYKILENKKNLIEQEYPADKNEWTGQYLQGDHHPTVFMWSENQGFLAWGSHHTFYPSRINFGKAEFSNGRLTIKPEINKDNLHFQYIPNELVPIKWDETRFLVPPDELINFAYAAHSGAESQIIQYLSRGIYSGKSRKGIPNMPKEYEKILKMKSIKPKIIAIDEGEKDVFNDLVVTLNVGSEQNVIEGMIFYHADSENQLEIRVIEVEHNKSKAMVGSISGGSKPKIGMKFTSKVQETYYNLFP